MGRPHRRSGSGTSPASYAETTTAIVRTCGERTTDLAIELLREALGGAQIHVVEEVPFSEALRVGYQVGISQGRPWTLVVDADVLILRDGIRTLLEEATRVPRSVFVVQGIVFDKFFAAARPAGNHVYRTSLLVQGLESISARDDVLRPESSTVKAMKDRGHPSFQSQAVVGAHDFEQYHSDIFRKCFLQAHKHTHHSEYLMALWQERARQDRDFQVAYAALMAGREFTDSVRVSKDFMASGIERALAEIGVEEKGELKASCKPSDLIQEFRSQLSSEQLEAAARLGKRMSRPKKRQPLREWFRRYRSDLRRRSARTP